MWDEITYPFPNFNAATVEVWERIRTFIPYLTGHVQQTKAIDVLLCVSTTTPTDPFSIADPTHLSKELGSTRLQFTDQQLRYSTHIRLNKLAICDGNTVG